MPIDVNFTDPHEFLTEIKNPQIEITKQGSFRWQLVVNGVVQAGEHNDEAEAVERAVNWKLKQLDDIVGFQITQFKLVELK